MPTTINATIQSGAPAGFAAAVQAAVQYFENTLTNNVTVNLTFDWAPLTGTAIAQTDTGANFIEVSYDSWKAAMLANATAAGGTADNLLAAQSLPATNTIGDGMVLIPYQLAAAIGLAIPGASSDPVNTDATITLNSNDSFTFDPANRAVTGEYDAVGSLEHEISEALGRVAGSDGYNTITGAKSTSIGSAMPLNFFRYSGGVIDASSSYSPAVFSLDGGKTGLMSMGESGGDLADWSSGIYGDSAGYASKGQAGIFTAVDLQTMSAIGWHVAANAALDITNSNDTFAATGAAVQVGQNVSGVTVNGNGNTVTVSGAGSTPTIVGSSDSVTVNAASTTVGIGGNGQNSANIDTVNFVVAGTATVAINSTVSIGGQSAIVSLAGNDTATITAATSNVIANGAGTTITLGGNAMALFNATNCIINVQNGATVQSNSGGEHYFAGSNDALSISNYGMPGSDQVTVAGTGSTVTIGRNGIGSSTADVVTFAAGGTLVGYDNSSLWVGGDGVSATLGASDYLSIVGSAETVAIGGAGSAVTIGGNGQTAAVADAVIASGAASVGVVSGSRVNLNGSSLGVVLASNDTIGLAGSAEVVSASGAGDLVFLGANGIGASVADLANFAGGGTLVAFDNSSIAVGGNGVSAVLGNSDYLNIVGSSEVVTITGTGSAVTIGGNGQLAAVADAVVVSAAAAVGVVSGSRVNLNGSHLAVFLAGGDTIGLAGSGENVYASGVGNLVFLGGNGINASVADGANFAGGGALVGFDNSNLGVSGNGVSVSLGNSDYLNIVGANETVSVSGTGSAVTIGGNGQTAAVADTVNFAAGGAVGVQSNSSVSVSGNGVNVALGNSDTLAVSGLNETLSLGASDALTLAGHFGTTTLAGFGATDQITLSGAIFPGAAAGFDYWTYLLGHATVSGGNTNITIGSDTLVLQNYALTAANKGQFHFG